ncbi:HEAT repeat domain-containing protein [Halobaculum sp. MBLA0147]|uniref:HEAT repeat domain-containing protein n=1 Tax=Halobaculum sp. MBLA0147 TaxID=3079934 RepID=UPI0035250F00
MTPDYAHPVVSQLPRPTAETAIFAGIVLLALLIAVAVLTLAESVYQYRRDRRRDRVREDVELALLSRMSDPDPEWDEWVASASTPERDVARELLDDYLRTVEGTERANLVELVRELGIFAEARETLDGGARHEKLQALGWFALSGEGVDPDRLEATCTGGNDLRAAAARVLYEADHPDARERGTDLLVGDGSTTLTTHGLDTLYRLYETDPKPLLDRAAAEGDEWGLSLVVQVLSVIRHTGLLAQDADWSFVRDHTTHESPSVRAAAAQAFGPPGWDPAFRESVPVERLLADPHRNVRRATYEVLAEWGDGRSLELLREALRTEPDQRSRLRGLEALDDNQLTELELGVPTADDNRDDGPVPSVPVAGDAAADTTPPAPTVDTEDDGEVTAGTAAGSPTETGATDPAAAEPADADQAVDVAVDAGGQSLTPDPTAFDRALAWVRADREASDR